MGSELYRFYVVLLYIPQVTPYIFCDIPHADQQLHVLRSLWTGISFFALDALRSLWASLSLANNRYEE